MSNFSCRKMENVEDVTIDVNNVSIEPTIVHHVNQLITLTHYVMNAPLFVLMVHLKTLKNIHVINATAHVDYVQVLEREAARNATILTSFKVELVYLNVQMVYIKNMIL